MVRLRGEECHRNRGGGNRDARCNGFRAGADYARRHRGHLPPLGLTGYGSGEHPAPDCRRGATWQPGGQGEAMGKVLVRVTALHLACSACGEPARIVADEWPGEPMSVPASRWWASHYAPELVAVETESHGVLHEWV